MNSPTGNGKFPFMWNEFNQQNQQTWQFNSTLHFVSILITNNMTKLLYEMFKRATNAIMARKIKVAKQNDKMSSKSILYLTR